MSPSGMWAGHVEKERARMTQESLFVAGVEQGEGVPTRPFGTCEQTLLFERREPAA